MTESQWARVAFAMGDDQRGGPGIELRSRSKQPRFAVGVERGGGFIEDQERGRAQQGAGEDQALPLAAGQLAAAVADACSRPAGKAPDALGESDEIEHAPQRIVVGGLPPARDSRARCR